MNKFSSGQIIAGMLSKNFSKSVQSSIAKNGAYHFTFTIEDAPTYWKKILYEILAIVKQLGHPTFFMTLSCVDMHCNELNNCKI